MLPELTETSYLSRFFAKFVEIIAAGLATALCGYLIAYLGSPLPSAKLAPVAVSAAPNAGEVARLPAQPAPATAAVDGQRAPKPVADGPPAQPARKAEKAALAVPAPKDGKAGTNARSEKSAEALARAALANFDADRPTPADAPIRKGVATAGSASPAPADVLPHQVDFPPPPAAVEVQPRRLATVDPLPPPSETAMPEAESPAGLHTGLFSIFKQVPDLLGVGTPSLAGEAPRPPMPVGSASREQ
ncbi:MAG TPA: hypothetical protein VGN55_03900 [Xanthobacteraceae bacterium]|jgi:hypothetical protein